MGGDIGTLRAHSHCCTRGHRHTQGSFTLLYSRNQHSSVKQLPSDLFIIIRLIGRQARKIPLLHCISDLLLHNKLPQTLWCTTALICYLTDSVGQEAGAAWLGFPFQGLSQGFHSGSSQPGLGSHLQLDWRRISFLAHMVVHSSWRVIGLRSLTPCSTLARGHPQFLALWTSLYGSLLHQSQRGRQSIQRVC